MPATIIIGRVLGISLHESIWKTYNNDRSLVLHNTIFIRSNLDYYLI